MTTLVNKGRYNLIFKDAKGKDVRLPIGAQWEGEVDLKANPTLRAHIDTGNLSEGDKIDADAEAAKAEADRLAKEQAEADAKAKAEAEQAEAEKADAEKATKAKSKTDAEAAKAEADTPKGK
jgi:membrane protein involved in colicin uptake